MVSSRGQLQEHPIYITTKLNIFLSSVQAISNFSWFMTGVNVPSPITLILTLKPGSYTSVIIGNCKTKNVIEFLSRELQVRHI